MRFTNVNDWLSWQETLNPHTIKLGLDRVSEVASCLHIHNQFGTPVVMVAGTNGKGSCIAFMESILLAAGRRVCSYTSPHLLAYNERIRINGVDIDDDNLCQAFQSVDDARGGVELTYFEFGTLAALDIFKRLNPDIVLLEVGLGGRLDAVNIIDADVAVITTIDIDHCEWLGANREVIGMEKAGIIKPVSTVICGDANPPQSVMSAVTTQGVDYFQYGEDFVCLDKGDYWTLSIHDGPGIDLPLPSLQGDVQCQNAATSIMALHALPAGEIDHDTLSKGLQSARLHGRFETIATSPQVIVDVAHNPQAARALSAMLVRSSDAGKTHAIISMLTDKDIDEVVDVMAPSIDTWHCAGLDVMRGATAEEMADVIRRKVPGVTLYLSDRVDQACTVALELMESRDRVIVFGSFITVQQAIEYFK